MSKSIKKPSTPKRSVKAAKAAKAVSRGAFLLARNAVIEALYGVAGKESELTKRLKACAAYAPEQQEELRRSAQAARFYLNECQRKGTTPAEWTPALEAAYAKKGADSAAIRKWWSRQLAKAGVKSIDKRGNHKRGKTTRVAKGAKTSAKAPIKGQVIQVAKVQTFEAMRDQMQLVGKLLTSLRRKNEGMAFATAFDPIISAYIEAIAKVEKPSK